MLKDPGPRQRGTLAQAVSLGWLLLAAASGTSGAIAQVSGVRLGVRLEVAERTSLRTSIEAPHLSRFTTSKVGFCADGNAALVVDQEHWRVLRLASGESGRVEIPAVAGQVVCVLECAVPTHVVVLVQDEKGRRTVVVDTQRREIVGRKELSSGPDPGSFLIPISDPGERVALLDQELGVVWSFRADEGALERIVDVTEGNFHSACWASGKWWILSAEIGYPNRGPRTSVVWRSEGAGRATKHCDIPDAGSLHGAGDSVWCCGDALWRVAVEKGIAEKVPSVGGPLVFGAPDRSMVLLLDGANAQAMRVATGELLGGTQLGCESQRVVVSSRGRWCALCNRGFVQFAEIDWLAKEPGVPGKQAERAK